MHQEAADELARIERHHPVVSLGAVKAIILPREGDALVVGRDQAAVGDGDTVGGARKIAQDLLRAPEWTLGIDDPVFVVQRCQISREGFWIGQRHVLAEELQLSGTMNGSKFFQDEPSKRTRETPQGERKLGRQATQRVPSREMPPPGTIMWIWGWWVRAEPQVCKTERIPMRAPRCLGSAAMVSMVSAEALNRIP